MRLLDPRSPGIVNDSRALQARPFQVLDGPLRVSGHKGGVGAVLRGGLLRL